MAKDEAESSRCAGNHSFLFSFLFIYSPMSPSFFPFIGHAVKASLFLPRFYQADASRTSPSFELPAGNVAYRAGYLPVKRRVHIFVVSNTRKAIFSQSGISTISSLLCTPWTREAIILLTNSQRNQIVQNRSFKIIFNLLHALFTFNILFLFSFISSIV